MDHLRRERSTDEVPELPVSDRPDAIDRMALLELLAGLTPRARAFPNRRRMTWSSSARWYRRPVGCSSVS
jgi:hypothetical protein